MRSFSLAFALLALAALIGGCGARAGVTDGRPLVVATTGIVADLARRVGGDVVDVKALMGAGVDPHLYKASPGDVRLLERADLVLYNGEHLEGKMGDVLRSLAEKRPVVAVAESLPRERLVKSVGAFDPHVWFDVALWARTLPAVVEALCRIAPTNKADFVERAKRYEAELLALDRESREALAAIPGDRRVLVTAHDAFRYFGRAYGVEVVGVQGISTESEAGLRRMNEIVDLLVRRRVSAVFVESSVSPKNVQALIEGARSRGHAVRLGGQLYSDALGEEGTPEGTYVGMVRANVRTIVEALR